MRLIKCYVENFGKLSCFEQEFDAGLNCFLKDNSWGKSTLAAFIKAMLYGLPQSRVTDISKNERKKYAPWNGKTFGGSLTFEYSGKIYRIERTFSKGKDDFYRLTDMETGAECDDLGEEPGFTIFGVNGAAFEKSAYVSLDGVKDSGEGTKSITARLNGITEAADLSSYDDAVKALDERRKYYSVTRGGGVIGECKKLLADYGEELEKRENIRCELETKRKELEEHKKRAEEHRQSCEDLKARIKDKKIKNEEAEIKSGYLSLKQRCDSYYPEYASLSEFFKKGVPEARQIDECERKIARFETYEKDIRRAKEPYCVKAMQEKKYFASYLPELEEVYALRDDYKQALVGLERVPVFDSEDEELFQRLEGYAYPSSDELYEYEKDRERLVSLSAGISIITESLCSAEQGKKPSKAKSPLLLITLILSAILITGGALALILSSTAAGVALSLIGAVLLVISGFIYFKQYINSRLDKDQTNEQTYRQKLSLQESELSVITEKCALFNTKYSIDMQKGEGGHTVRERIRIYSRLCAERDECEKEKKEALLALEKTEEAIIRLYQRMEHSELTLEQLDSLIKRLEWYHENIEQAESTLQDAAVAKAELERAVSQVENFLSLYPTEGEDCLERLSQVRSKAQRYESVSENYLDAKEELDLYVREHPECANEGYGANALQDSLEDQPDIEVLEDELERERANLTSSERSIASLGVACDELSKQVEKRSDLEELIQEQKELLELYEHKARVIDCAKELLAKAKDNLSSRYLGKMREGFSSYLKLLSDSDILEGELDKDLAITLRGEGIMRSFDFFSKGTRDMLSLALHLALTDALFEAENSFIILDDPFANLDDTRLEKALGLLKELAKQRQIIYFTCSSNRVV